MPSLPETPGVDPMGDALMAITLMITAEREPEQFETKSALTPAVDWLREAIQRDAQGVTLALTRIACVFADNLATAKGVDVMDVVRSYGAQRGRTR